MTTTHRIGTSVALALALAASAAPAGARQFDLNANGSDVPAGWPACKRRANQPLHPRAPSRAQRSPARDRARRPAPAAATARE